MPSPGTAFDTSNDTHAPDAVEVVTLPSTLPTAGAFLYVTVVSPHVDDATVATDRLVVDVVRCSFKTAPDAPDAAPETTNLR